jgi:hypothetical protein
VDEAPAATTTTHTHSPLTEVLAALNEYGTGDEDAALRLINLCQHHAPDATAADVCRFIHARGRKARRAENPIGFLLTAVPKCFVGEWRAKTANSSPAREAGTWVSAEEALGD